MVDFRFPQKAVQLSLFDTYVWKHALKKKYYVMHSC